MITDTLSGVNRAKKVFNRHIATRASRCIQQTAKRASGSPHRHETRNSCHHITRRSFASTDLDRRTGPKQQPD